MRSDEFSNSRNHLTGEYRRQKFHFVLTVERLHEVLCWNDLSL